ncbi:MAG: hypothetical protein KAV42_01950 [Candidatus Krumholzibacteria bacterium]|nr:hypothetical protein [Candidatus Krumholzibacteria bacterium]
MPGTLYVGMDLGKSFHQVTVVDEKKEEVGRPFKIKRGSGGIEKMLKQMKLYGANPEDLVVTLHTTRDPVVPLSHEYLFAQVVADAGNSGWLRQYEVDRFGHCAFTGEEVIGAFLELVAWAESLEEKAAKKIIE